jgi:peptidoglycan/xylan/chitin deacetylase (PgdA/CDA1 family)
MLPYRLRDRAIEAITRPRRRLEPGTRAVALTFDDGPHPQVTPQIVEILRFYEVTATFFAVGERVREHGEIVRLLHRSGHTVGSHSQTHPDPWEVDFRALRNEYQAAAQLLSSYDPSGTARLFRPPKGYLDLNGAIVSRVLKLQTWLWTIDSEDWQPGVSVDDILATTATTQSGDVILLHDGLERPLDNRALDRSSTVAALPTLIESIRAKGLRFVALPN